MLDVAREDEAALFDCQLMYGWIIHASLMQIVLNVFDVTSPIRRLTNSLTRSPVCRNSITMAKSRLFCPATCKRALYSVFK